MFLKAFCIIISSISCFLCVKPPPPSKDVSEKKGDKVKREGWVANLTIYQFPIGLSAASAIESLIYILLMIRGDLLLPNTPEIMQLREVKAWHLAATALCLFGLFLRRWSFIALDKFFTYQLTIRPGHMLVKNGPYKYIRHPSYTGVLFNLVGFYSLVLNDGLFDVFAVMFTRTLRSLLGNQLKMVALSSIISIPRSLLGIGCGIWIALAIDFVIFSIMEVRVKNEEAMLKEHFDQEWDQYASKRWIYVPLVY
ncbi:hypothetical protein BGX21_002551 [Mortierella sp. AD011]|nr:hypothetical protein BGX20_000483 [Mortierella sp. AD010]KAF9379788.1 hypothetical protein BGX21_002551 [Mortierella sp. AD011]